MNGIIEQLNKVGSENNFIKLIKSAGIEDKLNNEGPFTIFAPNDEAFNELPESTLEELTTNSKGLREVLNYHIVTEEITKRDLENIPILETLQGDNLLIETQDEKTTVNDALIIKTDIKYSGGRVHVIDSILMP